MQLNAWTISIQWKNKCNENENKTKNLDTLKFVSKLEISLQKHHNSNALAM